MMRRRVFYEKKYKIFFQMLLMVLLVQFGVPCDAQQALAVASRQQFKATGFC